jgi:hypothetical protein
MESGSLNLLEPSGTVQAYKGITLPLPLQHKLIGFYNLDEKCLLRFAV